MPPACNPGKHRLYDWIAREPDSYRFTPVTALDGKAPTIYSLLSGYGRKVVSLNVPMTYPPTPVNGVMVSGMPTPSTDVQVHLSGTRSIKRFWTRLAITFCIPIPAKLIPIPALTPSWSDSIAALICACRLSPICASAKAPILR